MHGKIEMMKRHGAILGLFLFLTTAGRAWRGEAQTIENFESGVVNESVESGYYWKRTDNAGTFVWDVSDRQGAAGSSRSLEMTVLEGSPYFWYLNSLDQDAYVTAEPANRLSFYVKFPKDWMRFVADDPEKAYNFHVGTYHRDPNVSGSHETHNWHFYYHLKFDVRDEEWIHVVLTPWVQHQRGVDAWNPGVAPTRPVADFFGSLSRLYFTGLPYHTDAGVGYPYRVYFDEFRFYYENDFVVMEPETLRGWGMPGRTLYYPVTVFNTDPARSQVFGLATSSHLENASNYWSHDVRIYRDANGDGVCLPSEHQEVATTGEIPPRGAAHLCVAVFLQTSGVRYHPDARLHTTVIAWRKSPPFEADPHIMPVSTNFGVVPGTPAAATSIVTEVGPALPVVPVTEPVRDLSVIAAGKDRFTLSWTVPKGARRYDIRYAIGNEVDFESGIPLPGEPAPLPEGATQIWTTPPHFEAGKSYAFVMKVFGEGHPRYGAWEGVALSARVPPSNVARGNTIVPKGGNVPPTPRIRVTPIEGESPLAVTFDATGSSDPDGTILYTVWRFDDGSIATAPRVTKTFTHIGTHPVRLSLIDDGGMTGEGETTVTVLPGEEGTLEIPVQTVRLLYQGEPKRVFGGEAWMGRVGNYGGRNRLYLAFDLSEIPPDATILSAKLRLFQTMTENAEGHPHALYRVLKPVDAAHVTWREYAAGSPWERPGALGPSDAEPIGDVLLLDAQSGVYRRWNVLPALQYWREHPEENHGLLLVCKRERKGNVRYATDAAQDVAARPILEVTYRRP
ncbi:MAG: DNRLRE domain-containing protein [Deltaproteobacteria bacterium]|nr:MAG: DNRLRE domain-containing protein [Deltaproteobacteria bacterium]